MSEQPQESLSFVERSLWARYAFSLLLVACGTVIIWTTWDDTSASTSVLHHHLFLMGAALVWTIIAVTQALAPWWGQARTWLIAAHLLIMGSYIGLAIATTNWAALTLRGWLQFWWAYPLMAGQIQQVLKLSRVEPPQSNTSSCTPSSTVTNLVACGEGSFHSACRGDAGVATASRTQSTDDKRARNVRLLPDAAHQTPR